MRESQPKREDFQKLLSAAYFLQTHPESGRSEHFREKQEEGRAYQHSEVLSRILTLRTLFELEQLNFEAAAQATVKFAMETLQCYGAAIGVVEENHIRYCASSGRNLIRTDQMPLTTSPSALCIESKAAFVSANVPRDERLPPIIRNIGWLRSLVVIPIFLRKGVAATLEMYFTKSKGFEVKDINTYEVLGVLIGKVLLTETNVKISDELESERAETKARLEQLRPQLELLSGKTEISAYDERDRQLPSPQDGLPIPHSTDLAASSATLGPKAIPYRSPVLDCALNSAVNSEFDPISALLITEHQVPTGEVSTVVPNAEMVYAHTGSISASVSPITTMQETLPRTSKKRGRVGRKDSARWRANFYLVFAGVVAVWSLFFQGHGARLLRIVDETEHTANDSVVGKRAQPNSHNGNPGATVWVDPRRMQYYCSDSQPYGQTEYGKFMAQSEAQLNQYQPARHRTCE